MSEPDTKDPSLIYVEKTPNLAVLTQAYNEALTNNDPFYDECWLAYQDRNNEWPGKSGDGRKKGPNAFPWNGASDQEVNVTGERVDTYVAMTIQASKRSHIKAMATSANTLAQASIVSNFLKWMRAVYIPGYQQQMELATNYFYEKGIAVTYVGWTRETRTRLQSMSLDEIVASFEGGEALAEMILSGENDDELAAYLMQGLRIKEGRAKRAIRELRNKGETEIPVADLAVDCPCVHTCAPDGEVIMPAWTTDPQRVPYIFWRTFLTPQELEKKVANEGWSREWVDNALEKLRGVDNFRLDQERGNMGYQYATPPDDTRVMVVYAHQRLIDDEDGAEGIYRTAFHPNYDFPAKHELLNGYDDYPFVITRLKDAQKRIYETESLCRPLRGPQLQIKTERDSRIDRTSLATLPPIMHPAGRPPSDWGPGRKVPYRRLNEIAFGPAPGFDPGSIEIEAAMTKQADRAVGLDREDPYSPIRQQHYVDKWLEHERKVLEMAWKLFQRMGPDEVFFQVSGSADPMKLSKGSPSDVYSFTINFDVLSNDPENAKARTEQMGMLLQFDRNGQIDVSKWLAYMAASIDPVMADVIFQPQEVAQEKMLMDTTDDLAKIFAGIEVPARPQGAPVALQIIQQYATQPDVAQRLQQDEAFRARLENYAKQYSFQIQQAENAQIGKIGTPPAQIGGIETQNMSAQ